MIGGEIFLRASFPWHVKFLLWKVVCGNVLVIGEDVCGFE